MQGSHLLHLGDQTGHGADPGKAKAWLRRLRRLWSSPDPELVDAGQRGEWIIASIRLLIVTALLSLPLNQYLQSPDEPSRQLVLWVAVAALAEALVVYSAVMRSWGRSWIGFFSGILDVTLVTLSLWIFLRLDRPLDAVNDLVIFPVYILAIGATSLRYDWRICVLTGVSAVAEYLGLVAYAAWQWDLSDLAAFSWDQQIGRLILLAMATLLATALVMRAHEQRRLSNRDRLTDLANRGFFDESLERMGALAQRSREPVTIAMIDVDHFKRFNDTHGHLAGDNALRAVAKTLSVSFRTTDLVARYGGEEFAGVFPSLDAESAERRMEQMRRSIEQLPIPLTGKAGVVHVTVSVGVAIWPDDGESVKDALAVADLRLYQAKQAGRNRVVMPPVRRPHLVSAQGADDASL